MLFLRAPQGNFFIKKRYRDGLKTVPKQYRLRTLLVKSRVPSHPRYLNLKLRRK